MKHISKLKLVHPRKIRETLKDCEEIVPKRILHCLANDILTSKQKVLKAMKQRWEFKWELAMLRIKRQSDGVYLEVYDDIQDDSIDCVVLR